MNFLNHLEELAKEIKVYIGLVYTGQEVKRVFTPAPMASFCSPNKISSYLVRAKLIPLERRVSSFKCGGRRYQLCLNVMETETFTSTFTNETYKINHKFNGSESCLIYLLTFKTCHK